MITVTLTAVTVNISENSKQMRLNWSEVGI